MNLSTLKTLLTLRKVNQSQLAKMAKVSRQAVSHWFKTETDSDIRIQSPHLRHLAEGLRVSAEVLLRPLPVLKDSAVTHHYEVLLLWDRLYPDLSHFAVAIVRGEGGALGRLVQVFGLYQGSKIAGEKIWKRFPDYKKYIRPVRREQLEHIWQLRQNLI